ncbi:hypothetical protein DKT74_00980, partial [Streptomyces sp. ZEA17I]
MHRSTDEPRGPVELPGARSHPAMSREYADPGGEGNPLPDPAVLTALLDRYGWQRRGGAAG